MSSHLMSEHRNHHDFARALVVLAVILILLMLTATAAHARVSEAESGKNVKPMSAAEYARIKAQIRGPQMYLHVNQRPRLIHWKSGKSSGWLTPWPK